MRWALIVTLMISVYGVNLVKAVTIEYNLPDYAGIEEESVFSYEEIENGIELGLVSELTGISGTDKEIKRKKFIAITLAVTLGVFGVHRLYLGTATKVPIIYTLTLGGGFGFLVVSDIIAIIATKNLDKFSPNSQAFMWAE
ncbi:TM2 domain-containing protein [bacterium SCSIO 12643]|nr:TM2 domain-containing protein [bacterium SCSIO 12643]